MRPGLGFGSLQREFYIPQGAVQVAHKHSSAVAYLYERDGRPHAVLFHGKGAKPIWRYRFHSTAEREKTIATAFDRFGRQAAAKAEHQAERKAWRHSYRVGDVFRASWGYEQTNIDFYEVVELIGATQLMVRELAQSTEETGWLQGKCVPLPGKFTGEPFKVRAQQGYIKVSRCANAYYLKPTMIAGVPTYEASHWTAYA